MTNFSDTNIFPEETENSHTGNYCHISKSACTVVKLYTYIHVCYCTCVYIYTMYTVFSPIKATSLVKRPNTCTCTCMFFSAQKNWCRPVTAIKLVILATIEVTGV